MTFNKVFKKVVSTVCATSMALSMLPLMTQAAAATAATKIKVTRGDDRESIKIQLVDDTDAAATFPGSGQATLLAFTGAIGDVDGSSIYYIDQVAKDDANGFVLQSESANGATLLLKEGAYGKELNVWVGGTGVNTPLQGKYTLKAEAPTSGFTVTGKDEDDADVQNETMVGKNLVISIPKDDWTDEFIKDSTVALGTETIDDANVEYDDQDPNILLVTIPTTGMQKGNDYTITLTAPTAEDLVITGIKLLGLKPPTLVLPDGAATYGLIGEEVVYNVTEANVSGWITEAETGTKAVFTVPDGVPVEADVTVDGTTIKFDVPEGLEAGSYTVTIAVGDYTDIVLTLAVVNAAPEDVAIADVDAVGGELTSRKAFEITSQDADWVGAASTTLVFNDTVPEDMEDAHKAITINATYDGDSDKLVVAADANKLIGGRTYTLTIAAAGYENLEIAGIVVGDAVAPEITVNGRPAAEAKITEGARIELGISDKYWVELFEAYNVDQGSYSVVFEDENETSIKLPVTVDKSTGTLVVTAATNTLTVANGIVTLKGIDVQGYTITADVDCTIEAAVGTNPIPSITTTDTLEVGNEIEILLTGTEDSLTKIKAAVAGLTISITKGSATANVGSIALVGEGVIEDGADDAKTLKVKGQIPYSAAIIGSGYTLAVSFTSTEGAFSGAGESVGTYDFAKAAAPALVNVSIDAGDEIVLAGPTEYAKVADWAERIVSASFVDKDDTTATPVPLGLVTEVTSELENKFEVDEDTGAIKISKTAMVADKTYVVTFVTNPAVFEDATVEVTVASGVVVVPNSVIGDSNLTDDKTEFKNGYSFGIYAYDTAIVSGAIDPDKKIAQLVISNQAVVMEVLEGKVFEGDNLFLIITKPGRLRRVVGITATGANSFTVNGADGPVTLEFKRLIFGDFDVPNPPAPADGFVSIVDYNILLGVYGSSLSATPDDYDEAYDGNYDTATNLEAADGMVNITDYNVLLAGYGSSQAVYGD